MGTRRFVIHASLEMMVETLHCAARLVLFGRDTILQLQQELLDEQRNSAEPSALADTIPVPVPRAEGANVMASTREETPPRPDKGRKEETHAAAVVSIYDYVRLVATGNGRVVENSDRDPSPSHDRGTVDSEPPTVPERRRTLPWGNVLHEGGQQLQGDTSSLR